MKKLSIQLVLIILALASCTRVIDVDIEGQSETRLVVEGGVFFYENNPDSTYQSIRLTTSKSYFSDPNQVPSLSGATVSVTDLTTSAVYLYVESATEAGVYETNTLKAEMGTSYKLNIKAELDGIEQDFEAVSTIERHCPKMDSVFLDFEKSFFDDESGYYIMYSMTQDSTVSDFFYFQTFLDGELLEDNYDNPNFYNSLFDDVFFDAFIDSMVVVNPWILEEEETPPFHLRIKLNNLNKVDYDYLHRTLENKVGGSDTPAVEIKSSVKNKTFPKRYAFGMFYCSAQHEVQRLIEAYPPKE
ncbi:MAG: hypothetical protein ACPGEC_02150 [Flavobacteriales bacterium]